ncbi:unnamed protein product (macronuclear) [Paramecium tetraurelia]|uniref:Gustatory receptor n=1 Tax=Paramecium tetraurelia TaxID=5888 RepID=A0BJH5_PARTE|nr:uncharacterized protein GSPATT00029320001 [Paramecium tetraurelia]CAK58692.1 unnamed protein product [Paramecium tetraurelia]|eukprot:XP_001426090.1 hypothetical protein (macronuclear) [Paramecium tetraurelia strain d4-2]
MFEEQVANEIQEADKQHVRVSFPQRSWLSIIQDKIVQQSQMSQSEMNEKHETRLGVTPSLSDRETLCRKQIGQSACFREDLGKSRISDLDTPTTRYRTQPHEVHFRIRVFIKYLFLRVVFTVIGPLILGYSLIRRDWLSFMSNFRMIGNWGEVWYNYFRWISNYILVFTILYDTTDEEKKIMHYEIAFFIIVYITENVTYAIKFAFFHPSKLVLIENFDICVVGDSCEQSINPYHWAQQHQSTISKELEQSLKRSQVENSIFQLYFMVAPNSERLKRIQVPEQDLKHKIQIEETAADGFLMANEIINEFNKRNSYKTAIQLAILLGVIRVGLYILIMELCEESVKSTSVVVQLSLFQFMYFSTILTLMILTYRDLRRKVFSMTQLSHLISAEKVEVYQESKIFPTINLLCTVSIYSWVNLRMILLDYGLQYTRRQTFILSFIMIINTILMGVMTLLFYLELASMNTILQQTMDFAIIATFSIGLVLQGARINAHWSIHRGLLRKNLFLIQQLAYQMFRPLDYSFKAEDPVFHALSRMLDTTYSDVIIREDSLLNYSTFCISSIQYVFDNLGHQEKSQPYTVMGIAMTYQLLLQVCVSALGLIATSGLNFILQVTK